jgi:ubiquinone biosynthesis accessory factor UbiJ
MQNPAIFSRALQTAINAYLALDPESKTRVAKLQGKTVTIELLKLDVRFHLTFTEQDVLLQLGGTSTADTVIQGTPLRLLHLVLTPEKRKQFFADDVVITGNLELGQQVIDLFDQLEIDWEELLAQCIGDAAASQIGKLSRKLFTLGQEIRESLLQDVNDYVHEEVNFFPTKQHLQDFFADVDNTRMDTDRLEAKIHILKQKILGDA